MHYGSHTFRNWTDGTPHGEVPARRCHCRLIGLLTRAPVAEQLSQISSLDAAVFIEVSRVVRRTRLLRSSIAEELGQIGRIHSTVAVEVRRAEFRFIRTDIAIVALGTGKAALVAVHFAVL